MAFYYVYIIKPLLILGLFAYGISVYYRFWDHALKRRNDIFGTDVAYRDGIVFPFPRKDGEGDPRHGEYREFVFPRYWYITGKTIAAWGLAILISFT